MPDKPKIRPSELKEYLSIPKLPADFSERTVQIVLEKEDEAEKSDTLTNTRQEFLQTLSSRIDKESHS